MLLAGGDVFVKAGLGGNGCVTDPEYHLPTEGAEELTTLQ